MNHFIALVILSVCVSIVFSLLNRDTKKAQLRYFLELIGYFIVCSFIVSWIWTLIPW